MKMYGRSSEQRKLHMQRGAAGVAGEGGQGCMPDEAGNAASGLEAPLEAGREGWTWFLGNWEPWRDSSAGERSSELSPGARGL